MMGGESAVTGSQGCATKGAPHGGPGLDCQALDGAKILCGTNAIMLQPPKGGARYWASSSIPRYRRSSIFAAKRVEPDPQKGSRMRFCFCVKASINGFSARTGFCIGWSLSPEFWLCCHEPVSTCAASSPLQRFAHRSLYFPHFFRT